MQNEIRIIRASAYAGATDLVIGIFMGISGLHEWYWNHFHFFGAIGISMLAYAWWHQWLYDKRI